MTQRLYYQDAYCTEFDATLLRILPGQDGTSGVILDRTYFYPTSGGQPCDHGTLDGQPVVDVTEEQAEITHWVRGHVLGPRVHGQIDAPRRLDHMQQHTGQHILSEAFLKLLDAQTVSFHLGEDSCSSDLDRPSLSAEEAARVEELANQVTFSDRRITARIVTPADLSKLALRKTPSVDHDIRIVEVEGFDLSPCGGTHCATAGQVGPIAIRRWEHRGQETRVEFVCGWRALRDYRWKTATINQLALSFSVKDRELGDAVARLQQEAADNRRELRHLQDEMLVVEAQQLLAQAALWQGTRVVVRAFEGRDPQQVRSLATLLAKEPHTIALLGSAGEQGRLFFARSTDPPVDLAALLKTACRSLGGSGGGQSHQAQGGGLRGDQVRQALDLASQTLRGLSI